MCPMKPVDRLAFLGVFASVLLIASPHIGITGPGRPLFLDEAIHIDAGIRFMTRGLIGFRSSTLPFEPGVMVGVLASVLPGLATLLTGSYVWGRLLSVIQHGLVLVMIAGIFQSWSAHESTGETQGLIPAQPGPCSRAYPVLALGASFLAIPAIITVCVFSQGEIYCFAALLGSIYLWSIARKPALAGATAALAIHFKLAAVLALTGAALGAMTWDLLQPMEKRLINAAKVRSFLLGFLTPIFFWHSYEILRSGSLGLYLTNWKAYLTFVLSRPSVIPHAGMPPRWKFLITSLGEVGSASRSGKVMFVSMILAPVFGFCLNRKALKAKLTAPHAMLLGASLTMTAWWLLMSEGAWIRYGFIGLMGCCFSAVLSLRPWLALPAVRAAVLTGFLTLVAAKTISGYREFRGTVPGCNALLYSVVTREDNPTYRTFCVPGEKPLSYRSP